MKNTGLSPAYCAFRLKTAWYSNLIAWFLCDGVYIVVGWIVINLQPPDSGDPGFLNLLFGVLLVALYLGPMFLAMAAYRTWLKRYARTYEWEITNDDVIIREGVFSRVESRVPFSRIQNVGLVQGFWEKIYGWHTILLQTAGGPVAVRPGLGVAEGRIKGLRDPAPVQQAILDRARQYLTTRATGLEEIPAGRAGVPAQVQESLTILQQKLGEVITLLKEISRKLGNTR